MSLNKILLIGNLGSDPEVRNLPSGKMVATFRMATNRRFKQEGEIRKETEWFSVTAFGRLAEICSEFLKKGKCVFIEGTVRTRSWIDASGARHFRTEVIAQGMTLIGSRNGQPASVAQSDNDEPF